MYLYYSKNILPDMFIFKTFRDLYGPFGMVLFETEKKVDFVTTLYSLTIRSELSITLCAHVKMIVVFSVNATPVASAF